MAEVNAWNTKYPVGTKVQVRLDSGETKETVTRSRAEVLSGHSAVICLEGVIGCYLLSRVTAAMVLLLVCALLAGCSKPTLAERERHDVMIADVVHGYWPGALVCVDSNSELTVFYNHHLYKIAYHEYSDSFIGFKAPQLEAY